MNLSRMIIRLALAGAFALAGAGLASPARAGSVCFLITADTTGLAGTSGFLDLQMNPSTTLASPSVTATVTEVSTDGTLGSTTITTGVTGSFSSTPAVMNNMSYSELQQTFTYGTTLSFEITLSGSEINPSTVQPFSGTMLTFALEDSTQTGLNAGPLNGEAVDLNVNQTVAPNVSTQTYGPASGNYPTVTITPCAAVPEPSSMILMGLGLGAVIAVGRSRRPRS